MSALDAYKVTFDFYVFAHDLEAADQQVRAWRPLAQAAGFDPGSGSVKKVTDARGSRHLDEALAAARGKLVASERQRSAALRGLAKHLGGELEAAEEFLAAIERVSGPVQRSFADTFAQLGARP